MTDSAGCLSSQLMQVGSLGHKFPAEDPGRLLASKGPRVNTLGIKSKDDESSS